MKIRREDERRLGEEEQLDVEGKSPTSTWLRVEGEAVKVKDGLCFVCSICVLAAAADQLKESDNKQATIHYRRGERTCSTSARGSTTMAGCPKKIKIK